MAASVRKAAHDLEARKRTDDVLLSEGIDFKSLLLSEPVLEGLSSAGFQKPSPIQLKAIPLGRCGLDLIVQAKSGTGKTCVFCTIALDSLILENSATQVLVLAPTREIAVQIHSVVMAIGCAMPGLESHVFIGGRPVSQDKVHLKKCHVAIGSPGRIKQLIELGVMSTASIRLFVLDEADKLLEEGSFQEQINWIFSSLPVNKQMLALSATYPEYLAQHLTRYMREPTFVRLNPKDMGLKGLKQYYKLVPSHSLPHKVFEEKVQDLLELFSKIPFNQALVFSNLHSRAQHLADILSSKGLPAVCISGGLSQDQRLEAMSKLKQYQCRVLISTDLTSRGIDAEKVNLVINLDVPQDWETYMHRIGRAGRFGTQGLAVTYCCHGEEENKMMAIAQKCDLSLSALPSTLDASLMEEPCDWDVCSEASTPGTPAQLFSKAERSRRTKASKPESTSDKDADQSGRKISKKGQAVPKPDAERPPRASPVREVVLDRPARAVLTREELQEELPKIPPLSSFKKSAAVIMTLEQAEKDFWTFIRSGLGRSVEVIRDFRGSGDDKDGHKESIMLHDDGTQVVSHLPRSPAQSSSSECDMEADPPDDGPPDVVPHLPTGFRATPVKVEPEASPSPKINHQNQTQKSLPPQRLESRSKPGSQAQARTRGQGGTTKNETIRKGTKKIERVCEPEDDDDGDEEDEEEWDADSYWRACYEAWSEYYASMSPFQSYYHSSHSWMAAYRMNAVYMEELLKD
ncbi:putative ATP-dependent RNA helicase DDX20 [Neosynchiropus ocellatus]